ncbi:hypothetical protein MTO96_037523 [Rhipicephalus appendiculatus]
MAAHAGPPAFDEEADNWEAYQLRLEAYFEVPDVADEKKRRAILVTALSTRTVDLLAARCAPAKIQDLKHDDAVKDGGANVDHMASAQNTDNVHAMTMKRKGRPSRLPSLRESASTKRRAQLAARRGVPMLRQKWSYSGKNASSVLLNASHARGKGTLARVCQQHQYRPNKLFHCEGQWSDSDDYEQFLLNLQAASVNIVQPIYRTMEWDGVALRMQVDTGSPVTIITWPTYTQYRHRWPRLQKTTLQVTCFLGQLPVKGQLNVSVTYGGTTLEVTLVVLGCSGPDLCGRDVIKAFEQHGRQVLAIKTKAAPDTEPHGTTDQVGDSVWYRNYGTKDRWKAGVVQAAEGHRMVTIKAADGEHHRRHYDQLRARRTDSAGPAAGEAEVKTEAWVEAPQTEAGETGHL